MYLTTFCKYRQFDCYWIKPLIVRGISDPRRGCLLPCWIPASASVPHGRISVSPSHPQWPPVYDNSGEGRDTSAACCGAICGRSGLTWHSQVQRAPEVTA